MGAIQSFPLNHSLPRDLRMVVKNETFHSPKGSHTGQRPKCDTNVVHMQTPSE